ncbi:MAG: trehalose-phosphatase [Hyphomicrobiaceae bacterium]
MTDLSTLEGCALFLDFDGTLVDIAPTPGGVVVPAGLLEQLETLRQQLDGALAILTGRSVRQIDRLLSPLKFIVSGGHGAEIRSSPVGGVEMRAAPIDDTVVTAIGRLANTERRILVEPKSTSVAVHYRQAPDAGTELEAALDAIVRTAGDGLEIRRGRMVLEVAPRGVSKGAALGILMSQPVFRGRRPIVIGDDLTDESAFAAAQRWGGQGLKVAGEHFRAESADFAGAGEVRRWLAARIRRTIA